MKKISRRSFLKGSAIAAAAAAMGTGMAVQAEEAAEEAFSYEYDGEVPAADAYPITPEEFGSGEVKYTVEEMADGWIKVTNEGGAVLGYSEKSGVQLIQVDGYAFKDLNGDGVLDLYEDWRQDKALRAADLASKMTGEEIAPLLLHGGWTVFASTVDNDEYLQAGGRAGVTRSAGSEGNTETAVKWINAMQEYCEANGGYGVPATVSIDPNNMSGMIDQNALGATMDPAYAKEVAKEHSKEYRACGITMLLGPQIDVATDCGWSRSSGTYSEDPALNRDLAKAYIDGLQSSFDAEGNDLGWGSESVAAVCKHYVGAGAAEGGRNDHSDAGKYCVYPGDNFAAHLIPFFDGAFNLDGKTKAAASVMPNYGIAYSEDESLGEIVGGAYSSYKIGLLRENGWDGFILTDWQITTDGSQCYGVEDYTPAERMAMLFENDVDQIGGSSDMDAVMESWNIVVDDLGEEEATALFQKHAERFFLTQMNTGLFENPYISTDYALANVWNDETEAKGIESQKKALVMIKNVDGVIHEYDESEEKKTVYIPYRYANVGFSWMPSYKWIPGIDPEKAAEYYNVVTDTLGEPTGENGSYTQDDIIRADAADIASCDLIIVPMAGPYVASTVNEDGEYLPMTMQYEPYTAATAREEAIANDVEMVAVPDGYYGTTYREEEVSRSYKDQTVTSGTAYDEYQYLLQLKEIANADAKFILVMQITQLCMVWSEVEPLADAILCKLTDGSYYYDEAVLDVLSGKAEPEGLLPACQPASMEAVEASLEDVPRDVEVYVDSEGNSYEFTFGMNWSGKIDDDRVATYSAEPLTMPETIEFHYAE